MYKYITYLVYFPIDCHLKKQQVDVYVRKESETKERLGLRVRGKNIVKHKGREKIQKGKIKKETDTKRKS